MSPELLIEHRTHVAALLTAMAVFGLVLFVAWPHVAPHELARRLREQVKGGAPRRARRRDDTAEPQQAAGLRDQQSRSLARLVSAFRVADRLNDGRMVQKLQQAGYRGRGAALRYMAARIVSPLALLGGAGFYLLAFLPDADLHISAAILAAGGAFGWFLPPILLKNRIDKRRVEIGRAWPDAVDLLLICVETGMSIENGFRKVAEEMAATSIELAKEMSLTTAELAYLKERRQAYENLARRVEIDGVKAVTSTLTQSERYGTPLGHSLRVLAQESRAMRMAAAEKKAAALPPKLTVPMI
ncbi:MAG TPA: type II secretion system F family protein, partial [Paracoccaceae bacterium]|nr:type II secretion system F family protein [Paracoccaceae bacterium]